MYGLARDALRAWGAGRKLPRYRADQVFDWLWLRGAEGFEGMTDLPAGLRGELAEAFDGRLPREAGSLDSPDGTRKLLFLLGDGCRIEAVFIPREEQGKRPGARREGTLCVSTQVGCRCRCVFCRSGADGLRRDLTAGEIAGQLAAARRALGPGAKVRAIVLMGIGEPLDNYDNVAAAVRVWLDIAREGFTRGRVTLSTVGIPEGIARLSDDLGGRVGLALSLHSPRAAARRRIVRGPWETDPARVLRAAFSFRFPPGERLTIEYVMVDGLNDDAADARALAALLRGRDCMVNLIPVNPVPGRAFAPPPAAGVAAFQQELIGAGVMTFVRRPRGAGIGAACGQLAFGTEEEYRG